MVNTNAIRARITSYNVCYTKLLRAKAVDRAIAAIAAGIGSTVNLLDVPAVVIGGGMGERFFSDRQAQFESVITSYSIHYTKLYEALADDPEEELIHMGPPPTASLLRACPRPWRGR